MSLWLLKSFMGALRVEGTKSVGQFTTTHWSIVLNAADSSSPVANEAMERLCRAYWQPLYGYIRNRGYSADDAEDLTQEFFSRFLAKRYLSDVHPRKGRFRSFLLATVKHFLANEWDRANAEKRGGNQTVVEYDDSAPAHGLIEPGAENSPEAVYDREWALALLEQAMVELREDYAAAGKLQHFERLKPFLSCSANEGEYERLASEMSTSEGAITVWVHRLRQAFKDQLRAAIGRTVSDPGELEDEMRYLFTVINRE